MPTTVYDDTANVPAVSGIELTADGTPGTYRITVAPFEPENATAWVTVLYGGTDRADPVPGTGAELDPLVVPAGGCIIYLGHDQEDDLMIPVTVTRD